MILENKLNKEYLEHPIFDTLKYFSDFYNSLSFSIMCWTSIGTSGVLNFDTYVYSSIKGTIDSISEILFKGRINDAYALLRKYYDSTTTNIYTNLYLKENKKNESLIVEKIDNWIKGIDKIPGDEDMRSYISKSKELAPIKNLIDKERVSYQEIRKRCNDNMHYNFYRNVLLNDNQIYNPNRIKYLNLYLKDIEAIFIRHLAFIFTLNEHYMLASDYIDHLDVGIKPDEDLLYEVAPFIQDVFDRIIKKKRPDIADEIKKNTSMHLL